MWVLFLFLFLELLLVHLLLTGVNAPGFQQNKLERKFFSFMGLLKTFFLIYDVTHFFQFKLSPVCYKTILICDVKAKVW